MKFYFQILGLLLLAFTARLHAAPYVGNAEALSGFDQITSEQMDFLRTKKILFASRSFGLNLRDGLSGLAAQNSMYNILGNYQRYDVFNQGGDLSIIPADIYETRNFVHFLATYWPHSKRIDEVDQLLRNDPWKFSEDVDIVMIFFHYARPEMFPYYSEKLDALRADFPHIQFIYACAGYMEGATHASENQASFEFNELLKAEYLGEVPIYDLGAILSKDGAAGKSYAPEYSNDPAGVHPDSALGEAVMGKGFLVLLHAMYFGEEQIPPTQPGNLQAQAISEKSIQLSWTASTVDGGNVQYYQIFRDASPVATSFETTFLDEDLAESTAYTYSIIAVSSTGAQSPASDEATATTLADDAPPELLGVLDVTLNNKVMLQFSESIDPVTGSDVTNYTISGLSVQGAAVNGSVVTLTTSVMSEGTVYTVSVAGVKDHSATGNLIAPGASANYQFIPPALPAPVAHWSFNGNLNDDYGAVTTWVSEPSFGEGVYGQGLTFDGSTTSPYVRVNDVASHDGSAGLTVSLWARKNAAGVGGPVLKKHVAYDLSIGANSISGYIFNESNQSVNFSAPTSTIADTEWHHYVLRYDGSTITIHVDGDQIYSVNQSGNVANSPQPIYIGKIPWGSQLTFAGQIDELSIYNQAVDPSKLYQATKDLAAVEALLEANGVSRPVESMIVRDGEGRIIELYMQEAGISEITADIGQLTELRMLHCYGDRTLGLPLLTRVDPAIANCVNLQELLLNQNDLEDLPDSIINLVGITVLSVGDNSLADVTEPVRTWLNTYDPDWLGSQANYTSPAPTWQEYLQTYFADMEDQESIIGPSADPDLDGLANLIEYFLQSSPDASSERGYLSYGMTAAGAVFQFTHISDANALVIEWQTCSQLGDAWVPVTPLQEEVLEVSNGLQTSRITLPLDQEQKHAFYRLAVELAN